jgi:hypothetical protein
MMREGSEVRFVQATARLFTALACARLRLPVLRSVDPSGGSVNLCHHAHRCACPRMLLSL